MSVRLVSITNCTPGMVIGRDIYNEKGSTLISQGVALTQRMIESLKQRNIHMVYIRDSSTSDLVIKDDIPLELRIEAENVIKETFLEMKESHQKWRKAVDNLNVSKLQKVFRSLIQEIKKDNKVLNLLTNIYIHNDYIFSHSVNVTIYSLAIAAKLGYDDKKLEEIAIGGMLHDIGKIMIPPEILNKPGKLIPEEYDIMKKHTEFGFDILRKQSSISLLSAHCAYQHHEKLDGTGYPRNLKGNQIHPYAKIVAVADVFDALTSNRAYRKAMLPHEALEVLFAETNTHFDHDVIQAFQKSVATYPEGVTVKLSTGETGVVVKYNFHVPGRPVVRVIKDPKGNDLAQPYDLDLSNCLTVMITECDAILL